MAREPFDRKEGAMSRISRVKALAVAGLVLASALPGCSPSGKKTANQAIRWTIFEAPATAINAFGAGAGAAIEATTPDTVVVEYPVTLSPGGPRDFPSRQPVMYKVIAAQVRSVAPKAEGSSLPVRYDCAVHLTVESRGQVVKLADFIAAMRLRLEKGEVVGYRDSGSTAYIPDGLSNLFLRVSTKDWPRELLLGVLSGPVPVSKYDPIPKSEIAIPLEIRKNEGRAQDPR
ncbi:MAG TPA: hypothetical protein VF950_09960 [Planctomycetota bacterium]